MNGLVLDVNDDSFYDPYAKQKAIDRSPDLGIGPVLYNVLLLPPVCERRQREDLAVPRTERVDFTRTGFHEALSTGGRSEVFVRQEVLEAVRQFLDPCVAAAVTAR